MYKYNITKEYLLKEYVDNKKSTRQIAKQRGCSYSTVLCYLVKYNIKRRITGEINRGKHKYNISKKYLIQEYIKNKKSVKQISEDIGCDKVTVYNYLHDYNIKVRTKSEAKKLLNRTGKRSYAYKNGNYCKKYYCKDCGKEVSISSGAYGNCRCFSCSHKLKWKNKDFRDKIVKAQRKGRQLTPNKPEKLLNKLLNSLLSKEYKFVGDGKVILGGFCPDFINCNGQKKIIEMYGDYWHNKPDYKKRDKRRLIAYKKYGYKTLIVWEHELKDLEKVSNKILKFNIM